LAETAARPLDEHSVDVSKNPDLDEACTLYEKLMARDICAEEVCKFDVLKRIKDNVKKYSESVKMSSRADTLEQSGLETGHYIYWLSRRCFPTWQPQAITTTPNQSRCICRYL